MGRKGIFDWIIDGLAYLGGILLGCAVVIKFCDIILRYFFNKPLTWDIEITEYILFAVAFFGAAWLLKVGGHVRIDVLDTMLSERGRTYLHLLHSAVGALVSIILSLMSFVAAAYSYRDGLKVVKIYTIGKYYFLLIISLGFFLLLVEFVRQFATGIRTLRNQSIEKGGE
ncbi:MAG: Tripartite ATP-independent periplasmic transporter [Syntrophorhabdus sp. PtaU1.Bin058]|nr:MAG: Tripartite ATP-independent periplasmic transporter [Syntrophorhabdus sp. PtaU1.Bin058]